MTPLRIAVLTVAALGIALTTLLAAGTVTLPSLVTPGGLGPSAELIRQDFGDEAVDAHLTGYDGQQIYAEARFFPDLEAAAAHLDEPRYRLLRILPAVLASPAPAGAGTVLALVAVNLAGVGLAVWGVAWLLQRVGAPPAVAALAVTPLLLGVVTTTVGPIAWGLTLAAMELVARERRLGAVALLVCAALSRETAAVAAGLIGMASIHRGEAGKLRTLGMFALPGAVVLLWYEALGALVGGGLPSRVEVFAVLGTTGATRFASAIVFGIGLIGGFVWRDHPPAALLCIGFSAWMALYTADTLDPMALVRVNGLAVTLGLAAVIRVASSAFDSSNRFLRPR